MKKLISLLLISSLLLSSCGAKTDVPPENPPENIESSSSEVSSSDTQSSESSTPIVSSSESLSLSSSLPDDTSKGSSSSQVSDEPDEASISPIVKFAGTKYHLTTPAKKAWTKAYDTFYQSYRQNIKHIENDFEFKVRDNLYYRFFYLDGGGLIVGDTKNLPQYIQNAVKNPEIIMQKYVSEGDLYAIVEDKETKKYAGEARFEENGNEIKFISIDHHKEGEYEYRTSMTITEGIENQLLEAGFSPETTEAYAMDIPLVTHGVYFIDGKNVGFLPNADSRGFDLKYNYLYTLENLSSIMANPILSQEPTPAPTGPNPNPATGKPVIYLYPEKPTDVTVKLDYPQDFSYTYPQYNKKTGWKMTAHPDGKLLDNAGNEYYYLFWEGDARIDWNMDEGFVVASDDIETFLEEKLIYLGLNARERNDFITYWAPEMRENAYNLISFSTKQYTDLARLTVSPAPSTLIRVHMVYRPCQKSTEVKPQILKKAPKRTGFTVVEWGGTRAHY